MSAETAPIANVATATALNGWNQVTVTCPFCGAEPGGVDGGDIARFVGCYCGATGLLACIYYEYSHRLLVLIFDCKAARLNTAGRMQSYTCAKVMQFGENTKQKTLQNDKCH